MLDKIVISKDKKSARIFFDTHSIGVYQSDGEVVALLCEIIFEPALLLEQRHEAFLRSLENTMEIKLDSAA